MKRQLLIPEDITSNNLINKSVAWLPKNSVRLFLHAGFSDAKDWQVQISKMVFRHGPITNRPHSEEYKVPRYR